MKKGDAPRTPASVAEAQLRPGPFPRTEIIEGLTELWSIEKVEFLHGCHDIVVPESLFLELTQLFTP